MATIDSVVADNADYPSVKVTVDDDVVAEFPIRDGNVRQAEDYADAFIACVLLKR